LGIDAAAIRSGVASIRKANILEAPRANETEATSEPIPTPMAEKRRKLSILSPVQKVPLGDQYYTNRAA